MTRLSLAVRNLLAQDERFRQWIPKSASWDVWIFDEKPVMANFEGKGKCIIVINEVAPWTDPNGHNTLEFPAIEVDIWADPDRKPDGTILVDNAKDKIKDIARVVDSHLHRVDPGQDGWMIWGTAEQIAQKTGVLVAESKKGDVSDFSPIKDTEGAWMRRYTYVLNAY